MSIVALRHIQVAPDYRISVVTVKDKHRRISKLRVHRRKVKKTWRSLLSQLSRPSTVKIKYKLR